MDNLESLSKEWHIKFLDAIGDKYKFVGKSSSGVSYIELDDHNLQELVHLTYTLGISSLDDTIKKDILQQLLEAIIRDIEEKNPEANCMIIREDLWVRQYKIIHHEFKFELQMGLRASFGKDLDKRKLILDYE